MINLIRSSQKNYNTWNSLLKEDKKYLEQLLKDKNIPNSLFKVIHVINRLTGIGVTG